MQDATEFATGVNSAHAQGRRSDMYGAHAKIVSKSMQRNAGEQPTTGTRKEKRMRTTVGTHTMK